MDKLRAACMIAALGVLLCALISIPGALAAVDPTADFLYLDCGSPDAFVDTAGLKWLSDEDYISTGAAATVVDAPPKGWKEHKTLRYFRNSRAKNCYTLPVTPKLTYMLRAGFYFGSYDSTSRPPSFQLALDSTIVETVTFPYSDSNIIRELTFEAKRNVTSLCLVQDSSLTTPFISSIALRPVDKLAPMILDWLALNQTVTTHTRSSFASAIVLYPNDKYDRYWWPMNSSAGYPLRTANLVSATAPLERLNTSEDVSLGNMPSYMLDTPMSVLQEALTTSGNMTLDMDSDTDYSAYLQLYFVELDTTVNATDRGFYLETPGNIPGNGFLVNSRNVTGGSLALHGVYNKHVRFTSGSKIFMYPDPYRTSLKGPMLSAMELYRINISWVPPTNDRDWSAVEVIKGDMKLTSWRGDPCLPYPHEWVNCSTTQGITKEATILAVALSRYNLTGIVSPGFNDLDGLTSLKLDNNALTGQFPDLRGLTSLKTLHLQNNKLNGPLPMWLASLPNLQELFVQNNNFSGTVPTEFSNKTWIFNYSGNPSLSGAATTSSHSSKSKGSNMGIIIGAAAGGVVVLALLVFLIVCFVCRRQCSKANAKEPVSTISIASVPRKDGKDVNTGGAKEYSLAEIVAATNKFEKVIGRGGFGPVYYGKFPNGPEVAVKALDKTSHQGEVEFSNEVGILSRVHHKNLVSLVGFCRAEDKRMLVYEYIPKGSLRDHLDEDFSKSGHEVLDWRTRLNIALNAALGFEYLHTGCSPSLIHRDVKSSNILITSKYDAKVADFGLSRLVGEEEATQIQTCVKGTAGYLDPEYNSTQYLTAKSDVFGFGVVLLELITGRPPIDPTIPNKMNPNLCDWVLSTLQQGNMDAILDPAVKASCPSYDALWKVAETALQSVEPKSMHRPTMSEVVKELQLAVALEGSGSSMGPPPPPSHTRMPSGYSGFSSTSSLQYVPTSYPAAR